MRELLPIEGADRIELAKIDGWQCIVKKGDFKVGDSGLYFEIDSMIPATDERFSFLSKGKVVPFYRIKTMKMKGVLSQGLLVPLESTLTQDEKARMAFGEELQVILGVEKYEPPLPTGGQQKGTFPTHLVPKTDQERVQNITKELVGRNASEFEVTEKLDGTSCTIWYHCQEGVASLQDSAQMELRRNPYVGVASRNWEMDRDDSNVYAKVLRDNDLVTKLGQLGRNIAIQGEIIGPAIQGNKYQRATQELFVFDIYDIDAKRYLAPNERIQLTAQLGLNHVPVMKDVVSSMDSALLLALAEGQSELHAVEREGLVFKAYDGSLSFKAISNKWLLKYE